MDKSEYDEERPVEYPYDSGSMIGSMWTLKVPCLGNPIGTLGYCFNEYPDFDNPNALGIQVIFPNGEYDGFSVKEQNDFLEYSNYNTFYMNYKFTNVIRVQKDFESGYWKW